jgi:capsular polysaccharide biosynthesis protein
MTDLNEGTNNNKAQVKEINLKEIYRILKRRFWVIVVITLLLTILGGLYSKYTTNYLYQSSTRILVNATPDLMKTLVVMIKDPVIMEKVINQLELQKSPEGLGAQISVNNISDSQVVLISAVDNNPTTAAMIANTTAAVFQKEIVKILNFNDIQLLKGAKENPFPINDNQFRTIFLSMIIGIVLGIGIIFFLHSLDDTIKKEEDLEEQFGLPVIGNISKITRKNFKSEISLYEEVKTRGETVGIQKEKSYSN